MKIVDFNLNLALPWFLPSSDNHECIVRYAFAFFFPLLGFEIYFTKINHACYALFTLYNIQITMKVW